MFLLVNWKNNLTSALIEACNKYFYDYKGDRFILEAYLANSYLEKSKDHSRLFFLSDGRLYARRKPIIELSTTIQYLSSCSYGKFILYTFTAIG